jgi:lupus La protein
MSAPITEVEAAQPAVVADATQEQTKQEETALVDAQIKQEESASKAEETAADSAADVKTEDVKKTETEGEVRKEESESKPAPLLKTTAQLHKDVSNKKYDASVLPVTDDPQTIRTQVHILLVRCPMTVANQCSKVRVLLQRQQPPLR